MAALNNEPEQGRQLPLRELQSNELICFVAIPGAVSGYDEPLQPGEVSISALSAAVLHTRCGETPPGSGEAPPGSAFATACGHTFWLKRSRCSERTVSERSSGTARGPEEDRASLDEKQTEDQHFRLLPGCVLNAETLLCPDHEGHDGNGNDSSCWVPAVFFYSNEDTKEQGEKMQGLLGKHEEWRRTPRERARNVSDGNSRKARRADMDGIVDLFLGSSSKQVQGVGDESKQLEEPLTYESINKRLQVAEEEEESLAIFGYSSGEENSEKAVSTVACSSSTAGTGARAGGDAGATTDGPLTKKPRTDNCSSLAKRRLREQRLMDETLVFYAAQADHRCLKLACLAYNRLSRELEADLESSYIDEKRVIRFPTLPDTRNISCYATSDARCKESDERRNLTSQVEENRFNFFRDSTSFYRKLLGFERQSGGDSLQSGDPLVPSTLASFACIKWAGLHIKDDRPLVLGGMRGRWGAGWSIWDCSDRLRGDEEVCLEAYKDNYRAEAWFSDELKKDKLFRASLVTFEPSGIP